MRAVVVSEYGVGFAVQLCIAFANQVTQAVKTVLVSQALELEVVVENKRGP